MKSQVKIEDTELLLKLCCIGNKPVKVNAEISSSLIQLAVDNGLAAWCFNRLKIGMIDVVEPFCSDKWKRAYVYNTIYYQKYLLVFDKVQKALNQKDIPVIALKGMALASGLYADEGLRPMGDIDILVPEGSGSEALSVLLEAGAKQVVVPRSELHEKTDAHMRALTIDGVMVEIHQRLFALGSDYYIKDADYFASPVHINNQGVQISRLNDVWMLYHLVAHAIKGIHMGGLRLGWLLDIALLLHKSEDAKGLVDQVLVINPSKKKAIGRWLGMAMFLLPLNISWHSHRQQDMAFLSGLIKYRDVRSSHRLVNFWQLLKTPGITNKITLLWRECFPSREYMYFRYKNLNNKSLWRLYAKRLLRV